MVTSSGFSRQYRIPEGKDFVSTVRSRPWLRMPGLRVHLRPNGLGHSRLGVSVGRKFGGAVIRNRLKRLLRESFRRDARARAAGVDIVVVATGGEALDHLEQLTSAVGSAVDAFENASRKQ